MRELVSRCWRFVAVVGGAALALLHLWVLWRRVADGTLLAPLVVAQWTLAIALLVGLIALRRRGIRVFRGRAGAAFWIVVALMHGVVALPGGPGFVGVLVAVPAPMVVPVGLGLLAGALVLVAGLERARAVPSLPSFAVGQSAPSPSAPLGLSSGIAPRAPPA